jgi:sugar lactone lactonase YvrE
MLGVLPASAQVPNFLGQWVAPRAVGVTFDPAGNVYVAEYANYPTHIDVHAPDGTLLARWGMDGSDTSSVTGPEYIAADANGHLWIAEWEIHNEQQSPAQEFTTSGAFIGRLGYYCYGSCTPGPGAIGSIGGIAVGPDGRVYVTDMYPRRTQIFDNDRNFIAAWPSIGNSIAIDANGHAFEVGDDHVVRKYDAANGTLVVQWGSYGTGPGQFNQPQGVALDAAGNVYVTDTYNHRVQVFDNNGGFLMQWGGYGSSPGQFYRPMGIGVAADGKIYVGDTWNNRVQIFGSLPTPARTRSWGHLKAAYR